MSVPEGILAALPVETCPFKYVTLIGLGLGPDALRDLAESCRVPNYFIKVFANCFMKKSADCTTYMQKVPLARNFFD